MKALLKRGVRQLKYQFARGALILVYHRIHGSALDPWWLSVTPEHFAEHLQVLRRAYHPTSLQALAQTLQDGKPPQPKSIVITFDDGYADNLYNAKPLLEHFDCPATVFIVTGVLGASHEFWWDELASLLLQPRPLPDRLEVSLGGEIHSWQLGKSVAYSQSEFAKHLGWRVGQSPPSMRHDLYFQLWKLIHPLANDEQREVMSKLRAWAENAPTPVMHRIMTPDECLQLSRSEQIEIGAHTVQHSSLAVLSCDAQRYEISESKGELERLLDRPVEAFSYPFGKRKDYSVETTALVREAGYSVACSNDEGVIGSTTDLFQLPRIHIPDCGGAEFENRLVSKFYV